MQALPFAACVPFGRELSGVLFRAGAHKAATDAMLQRIEGILRPSAAGVPH